MQAMPVPRRSFGEYDALIAAGADHFSFCYEFEDPGYFEKLCPGKAATLGQSAFFEAMEYTAEKLGRGRVSGEIIAGLEPIGDERGIDRPSPRLRRSASSAGRSSESRRASSRPDTYAGTTSAKPAATRTCRWESVIEVSSSQPKKPPTWRLPVVDRAEARRYASSRGRAA